MMNNFKSAIHTLSKMVHSHTLNIQRHYLLDKIVKYPTYLFRDNFSNFNNFISPWQDL